MENCVNCGGELTDKRVNGKYKVCYADCNREYTRKKYKEHNLVLDGVTSGTTGTISELAVGIDLLSKGYDVFKSLSPNASFDIAIFRDKKFLRVEIKTGYYTILGRKIFPKGSPKKYDVLAVYFRRTKEIDYFSNGSIDNTI